MSVEAAPSWRTPQGRSAICLDLGPAEAVAIPRAYVHWVVTEYGTAYLFGRPLPERAVALADTAHPDARKSLLDAAIDKRARRKEAAVAQDQRQQRHTGAFPPAPGRRRGEPLPPRRLPGPSR